VLDIEIDGLDEVVLGTIYEHRINSSLDEVVVSYDNSATTYIDPNEYHLVSSGIYTGRLDGNVPQWLTDYVSDQLSTGGSLDVNPIIEEIRDRLTNAENSVNQNLTYIQTADSTLSALETTVVANYNENHAGILSLEQSVATKQEASTLAVDVQQSLFGGDVEAYVTSVTATYANDHLAYASDYQTLVAAYNDIEVSIEEVDEVIAGEYSLWDGVSEPQLGQIRVNGTITEQYLGVALGWVQTTVGKTLELAHAGNQVFRQTTTPSANDLGDIWVRTNYYYTSLTGTSISSNLAYQQYGYAIYKWNGSSWVIQANGAIGDSVIGWAASSRKLITNPTTGAITGWAFGDGSNATSTFAVYAQNFRVNDGTNTAAWNDSFSIQAGSPNRIKFNGIVDFTNTSMTDYENDIITSNIYKPGTTTINGGILATDTIWIGGGIQSNNYVWGGEYTTGFGLFAEGDPDSGEEYNIIGGGIYGSHIDGALIWGSFISSVISVSYRSRVYNASNKPTRATAVARFYSDEDAYSPKFTGLGIYAHDEYYDVGSPPLHPEYGDSIVRYHSSTPRIYLNGYSTEPGYVYLCKRSLAGDITVRVFYDKYNYVSATLSSGSTVTLRGIPFKQDTNGNIMIKNSFDHGGLNASSGSTILTPFAIQLVTTTYTFTDFSEINLITQNGS
jgi:hypothetical protein